MPITLVSWSMVMAHSSRAPEGVRVEIVHKAPPRQTKPALRREEQPHHPELHAQRRAPVVQPCETPRTCEGVLARRMRSPPRTRTETLVDDLHCLTSVRTTAAAVTSSTSENGPSP